MLDAEERNGPILKEGEIEYFEHLLASKNGTKLFRDTNEQLLKAEARAKRILSSGVSPKKAKDIDSLIKAFAIARKILHILWANMHK